MESTKKLEISDSIITLLSGLQGKYPARAEKRIYQLETVYNEINKSYINGEILQKDFNKLKEPLGYLWDELTQWENPISIVGMVMHQEWAHDGKTELQSRLSDYPTTRNGANKFIREVKAIIKNSSDDTATLKVANDMLVVVEDFQKLNSAINDLKDMKVTKTKADIVKTEEKAKESAKKSSHKDVIAMHSFMSALMSNHREEIQDMFTLRFIADNARIVRLLNEHDLKIPRSLRERSEVGYTYAMVSSVLDDENPSHRSKDGVRTANISSDKILAERAVKKASDITTQILEQYLFRVSDKLAPILVGKDNLSEIKCDNLVVDAAIEAVLNVSFKDGGSFDLHTRCVWAVNPVNPGVHLKIPSTFRNVKDSTGRVQAMLSEKKIQDEFTP